MGEKSCPTGSSSTQICSGHGICEYLDGSTGQELPSCSSGSTSCRCYCRCETGYGGAGCGMNSTELAIVSTSRANQCAAITFPSEVSVQVADIKTAINKFLIAFDPFSISTESDMQKCATSLDLIAYYLSNTLTYDSQLLHSFTKAISNIIESRRVFTGVYTVATESSVLKATDILIRKIAYMIAGGNPIYYVTHNLRLIVHDENLLSLNSAKLVSPSPTGQYITLPSTGMSACGYTGDTAQFAIIEWATSPYAGSHVVLNNILRFSALNHSAQGERSQSSDAFEVVLTWAMPQDWTSVSPNCSVLGTGTEASDECPCDVIAYTSLNMTLSCPDVTMLCSQQFSSESRRLDSDLPVTVLKSTEFSGVTIGNGDISAFTSLSSSGSIDMTSGTSFFTIFLACVVVGVVIFACWDSYEHSSFRMNKKVLEDAKIEAPEFTLKDAFTSAGLHGRSVVSFRRRPQDGKLPENKHHSHSKHREDKSDHVHSAEHGHSSEHAHGTGHTSSHTKDNAHSDGVVETGAFAKGGTLWTKLNKPVDLLEDDSNSALYIQALLRHHTLLRMFTYGSLRVTRVLRFVCFCSDIMLMIFVTTAFYDEAFPADNGCADINKFRPCIAEDSNWIDGDTLCVWDWPKLECSLRKPEGDIKYYIIVGLCILLVCLIPLTLIKWSFEYVYTKQVIFALQAQSQSEKKAQEKHTTVRRRSSVMMTPQEREIRAHQEKMKSVERDVKSHAACDEHVKNTVVVQHFVDEHLNPIERFFVRGHFFHHDHASPETLGILLWIFTLIVTVFAWGFFVIYTYLWTMKNEFKIVFAWGVTFFVVWAFEIFIYEIASVYLWHVLPINFVRGKLRYIYETMAGVEDKPAEVSQAEEGQSEHISTAPQRSIKPQRTLRSMVSNVSGDDAITASPTAIAVCKFEGTSEAREATSLILGMDHEVVRKLKDKEAVTAAKRRYSRPPDPDKRKSKASHVSSQSSGGYRSGTSESAHHSHHHSRPATPSEGSHGHHHSDKKHHSSGSRPATPSAPPADTL